MPTHPVVHYYKTQTSSDHFKNLSHSKAPPKVKVPGLSRSEAADLEKVIKPLRVEFSISYNKSSHTTLQHTSEISSHTTSRHASEGATRRHTSDNSKSGASTPHRPKSAESKSTESTSSESETATLEVVFTPGALLVVVVWLRRHRRSNAKPNISIKYNDENETNEIDITSELENIAEDEIVIEAVVWNKIVESLQSKADHPWMPVRANAGE